MKAPCTIRRLALAIPAVGLVLAAACAPASPAVAPTATFPAVASSAGTILFGVETSLTGPVAGWGQAQERTLRLWMKTVNQKGGIKLGDKTYQVDLKVYDNKGDVEQNAPLIERLINQDKVSFLYGPVSSRQVANSCPVNERYQIPSVNTFAFIDSIYEKGAKYCFSAQPPTSKQYSAVADLFKAKGVQTVVVVELNDEGGDAFEKEVGRELTARNIKVALVERYPKETTNFATTLSKIASLKPDAIAFEGTIDLGVIFRKQQVGQGIQSKVTYLESGPNVSGWEATGDAGKGVVSTTAWTPTVVGFKPDADAFWGTNADFVKAYKAEYNKEPEWADAVTAAAADIYLRALKKVGAVDPPKVRDAISSMRGANFYGPIEFDQRGFNVGPAASAYIVQDLGKGSIKVVFPEAGAEAPILFPAP